MADKSSAYVATDQALHLGRKPSDYKNTKRGETPVPTLSLNRGTRKKPPMRGGFTKAML